MEPNNNHINNWKIHFYKFLFVISFLVFIFFLFLCIISLGKSSGNFGLEGLALAIYLFFTVISGLLTFIVFDILIRLSEDFFKFERKLEFIEVFLLTIVIVFFIYIGLGKYWAFLGGLVILILYFLLRKKRKNIEQLDKPQVVRETYRIAIWKILLIGFAILSFLFRLVGKSFIF